MCALWIEMHGVLYPPVLYIVVNKWPQMDILFYFSDFIKNNFSQP